MLDEAIIHIGMNKTGSTSIQNSLHQFDDGHTFYAQLAHLNHSIPLYTAFHKKFDQYHIWRKQGLSKSETTALRTQFRAELEAQLATPNRQRILISGEDISSLDPDGAAELIALCRQYAKSIRIVVYVRDPLGFAVSGFQQRVKDGSDAVPDMIRPGYDVRIAKFVDLVGAENVTVRLFTRDQLKNASVVEDFCAVAGISMQGLKEIRANESMPFECLKLIYLFNRTNPCYFGDTVVMAARQKLIRHLMQAYRGRQSIDKTLFAPIADWESVHYLSDTFDLTFPTNAPAATGSVQDIDAWMSDLSDIALEPLDDILRRFDLLGRYATTAAKLSRIFYHLIHVQLSETPPPSSPDNPRYLTSADADALRKAALRYDSQTPPSRAQAIELMALAARARPSGSVIKQKLAEWREAPETR